jgi:hypothetical protein
MTKSYIPVTFYITIPLGRVTGIARRKEGDKAREHARAVVPL